MVMTTGEKVEKVMDLIADETSRPSFYAFVG